MLCSNCKKNIANFHYTKIVNGKKTELNLCSNCAAELGYLDSYHDPFDFGSVLNDFLGIESPTRNYVCAKCGTDYDTFKRTGRLGCSDCFEQFENVINDILPEIQAGTAHKGKVCGENNEELMKKKKLKELKDNLQKAILDERYEDAAKIRDEIKDFEGGKNNE